MWPFGRGRPAGAQGKDLGALGEKLTVRHLRRKRYKILARNFRCPSGEVDVIALDRSTGAGTVVFVEVKTRRSRKYVGPESAVDARKQSQLARAARYYLSHHDAGGYAVRFDVVGIVIGQDGRAEVRHTVDAFSPA